MLTQDFIQNMKVRLLDDKMRLERELKDLGKEDPNHPGHFIVEYAESGGNSEEDNASEASEYADDLSVSAKLEAEFRDTIKALALIEKGTYGICKYCKKEIDPKRLEARPTSSSCIACKKMLTQEM